MNKQCGHVCFPATAASLLRLREQKKQTANHGLACFPNPEPWFVPANHGPSFRWHSKQGLCCSHMRQLRSGQQTHTTTLLIHDKLWFMAYCEVQRQLMQSGKLFLSVDVNKCLWMYLHHRYLMPITFFLGTLGGLFCDGESVTDQTIPCRKAMTVNWYGAD